MSKKIILVLLAVWALLSLTGCGASGGGTFCDCDCDYCDCIDEDDQERHDDPGEYEGWWY